MKIPEVTPQMFFACGTLLGMIIFVADLYMKITYWPSYIGMSKVSAIAYSLMNLITVAFFYGMWKASKPSPQEVEQAKQTEEIFKELSNNEVPGIIEPKEEVITNAVPKTSKRKSKPN
jgi:muramoyltetrapeptide carboxypeptidase LdcA involved in peptidoglycan recycling